MTLFLDVIKGIKSTRGVYNEDDCPIGTSTEIADGLDACGALPSFVLFLLRLAKGRAPDKRLVVPHEAGQTTNIK